ncbi:hypothetical protein BKA69DRAFT_1050393 [Paraphysoderma sedebokerense]|nr:hypothetical protein BKA69DRAFT_1050393 [Paraphysoderma sedebokerense]
MSNVLDNSLHPSNLADLISITSSHATRQFIKGLLLGVVLMLALFIVSVRSLLLQSPNPSLIAQIGKGVPLKIQRRRKSSANVEKKSRRTSQPFLSSNITSSSPAPPLPLPIATLIQLHRQSLSNLPADAETISWLNLLISQVVTHYRSDQFFIDWLKNDLLNKSINGPNRPAFLGPISITHFSTGHHDSVPLFNSARIRPTGPSGHGRSNRASFPPGSMNEKWRAEIDFEFANLTDFVAPSSSSISHSQTFSSLSSGSSSKTGSIRSRKASSNAHHKGSASRQNPPVDTPKQADTDNNDEIKEHKSHFVLGIETQFLINWPKPASAALPIHLVLEVVEFKGTMAIELDSTVSSPLTPSSLNMSLSILPSYSLKFRISSLIGSRTKLRDVPKVTNLIVHYIRRILETKIVEPAKLSFKIPNAADFSSKASGNDENDDEAPEEGGSDTADLSGAESQGGGAADDENEDSMVEESNSQSRNSSTPEEQEPLMMSKTSSTKRKHPEAQDGYSTALELDDSVSVSSFCQTQIPTNSPAYTSREHLKSQLRSSLQTNTHSGSAPNLDRSKRPYPQTDIEEYASSRYPDSHSQSHSTSLHPQRPSQHYSKSVPTSPVSSSFPNFPSSSNPSFSFYNKPLSSQTPLSDDEIILSANTPFGIGRSGLSTNLGDSNMRSQNGAGSSRSG